MQPPEHVRRLLDTLGSRSSLKEVTAVLRSVNVFTFDGAYPRDYHFERWVLNDINGPEDVLKLCEDLNVDAREKGYDRCAKAAYILEWHPRWSGDVKRCRVNVARQRRVCCGCHETGSYAKTA